MKRLYIFLIAAMTVYLSACEKNTEGPEETIHSLKLVESYEGSNEHIEIYSQSKTLQVGYNKIWIKILDKAQENLVQVDQGFWRPVMHMPSMQHSSPHSSLVKSTDPDFTFEGYVVFTMASDEKSYWELLVEYTYNQNSVTETIGLKVNSLPKRHKNVQSFAYENEEYTIALIDPKKPKMGSNIISAVLLKSSDHEKYEEVNGWEIDLDPRMPSMDNHDSPNNKNLTQKNDKGEYIGTLNLSMSGYWRLNLKIIDSHKNVVKGEKVTKENEKSSVYFELEF